MIHLLRKSPAKQFQPYIEKAGLKINQVGEAIFITKESIMHILREELKKGNIDEVISTLKGKPLATGRKWLSPENGSNRPIRNRVATHGNARGPDGKEGVDREVSSGGRRPARGRSCCLWRHSTGP